MKICPRGCPGTYQDSEFRCRQCMSFLKTVRAGDSNAGGGNSQSGQQNNPPNPQPNTQTNRPNPRPNPNTNPTGSTYKPTGTGSQTYGGGTYTERGYTFQNNNNNSSDPFRYDRSRYSNQSSSGKSGGYGGNNSSGGNYGGGNSGNGGYYGNGGNNNGGYSNNNSGNNYNNYNQGQPANQDPGTGWITVTGQVKNLRQRPVERESMLRRMELMTVPAHNTKNAMWYDFQLIECDPAGRMSGRAYSVNFIAEVRAGMFSETNVITVYGKRKKGGEIYADKIHNDTTNCDVSVRWF